MQSGKVVADSQFHTLNSEGILHLCTFRRKENGMRSLCSKPGHDETESPRL